MAIGFLKDYASIHSFPFSATLSRAHEASHHHFDIQLERGGVYISFAVPEGIPKKPGEKNLAIRIGNHPPEYAGFEDAIPEGEYWAGEVPIGDRDLYTVLEWTDDKIEAMMKGREREGGGPVQERLKKSRG